MRRILGIGALSLAAVLAAGCGQKGPLYVPGYPKESPWPLPPRSATPDPTPTVPPGPGVPGATEPAERR